MFKITAYVQDCLRSSYEPRALSPSRASGCSYKVCSSVLMVEYWSAKFTLFKNGQYERDEWFIMTLCDAALLPNLRSS